MLAVIAPAGAAAPSLPRREAPPPAAAEEPQPAAEAPVAAAEAPTAARRAPHRSCRRARSGACAWPAAAGRRGGQRQDVHLAGRRADRGRARRRPGRDRRDRSGWPRDEEGHPRVHRVRSGRGAARAVLRRCLREAAAAAAAAAAPAARRSGGARSCAGRPACRRASGPAPTPVAPVTPVAASVGEQEEPMNAMRRGIAEHMRRSLDTSAHVTSAIEVDMSKVVAAREALKKEYQAKHGVNPTYLAFVTKAAIETLDDWPWINGEIRGEKIVTRSFVNVGVAVSLEDGQGPDRPGDPERPGPEPPRDRPRDRRRRRARADEEAHARRRPGRDVHDHEPGRVRDLPRHAGHQPAAGGDPRHVRARQAAVGRPGRARAGRDRDPAADEHHPHVRPPARRRRVRGGFLRDLRARLEGWSDAGA